MPLGDRAIAGEVRATDRPDIDLPTELEHRPPTSTGTPGPGRDFGRIRLALVRDAGACGGGADGLVEELGGGPGGRFACGAGESVEADDGVEVDLAALLVLGDLGVRQRRVVPQAALGESGGFGDLAS